MIELVTGPPGAGKSYFVVRRVAAALMAGRYCATNVEFTDGWQLRLARENWVARAKGKQAVARLADRFDERMYISGSLSELIRLRLPPCGKCRPCLEGGKCSTEGRGVMVLDEAHEWLNARTWDQADDGSEMSKSEAVAYRLAVVKFFATHRKLGWRIYLVTQAEGRLDNQVRNNMEYITRLKNMRKYRVWGLVPIVPFNLFVAITFWHASGGERVGAQMYLLKRLARIYDTMALPDTHLLAGTDGLIHLPLSPEQRQQRAQFRRLALDHGVQERGDSLSEHGRKAAGARAAEPAAPATPPATHGDTSSGSRTSRRR